MSCTVKKVIADVFKWPTQSGVPWKDIENALLALGADLTKGNGSRVRVPLNGTRAVFHRPHPKKETDKGALASMRKFLTKAGINHAKL